MTCMSNVAVLSCTKRKDASMTIEGPKALIDPTDANDRSVNPSPSPTVTEMLAEAREGEQMGTRKLTFSEQCGAFAALYAGVQNKTVARAFGISIQAASYISGCLENDPDPYRLEYQPNENHDLDAPRKVFMDHNRNRNPARRKRYR